jgi:hypothetical protein
VTNTLAYYDTAKITAVKRFIVQSPAETKSKLTFVKFARAGEQTLDLLLFSFILPHSSTEPHQLLENKVSFIKVFPDWDANLESFCCSFIISHSELQSQWLKSNRIINIMRYLNVKSATQKWISRLIDLPYKRTTDEETSFEILIPLSLFVINIFAFI